MKTEAIPRISVIDVLSTGLTEAARRPALLVMPILAQLALWLLPPFRVGRLLDGLMRLYEGLLRSSPASAQVSNLNEMLTSMREVTGQAGVSINLVDGIAGGWLGAPNIAAVGQSSRITFLSDLVLVPAGLPPLTPALAPVPWQLPALEVGDFGQFALFGLVFWVLGQVVAAVYLRSVASAFRPNAHWSGTRGLARLIVQVILFGVLLEIALFLLRMALLFALGMLWLAGESIIGAIMVFMGGIVLWLTMWCLISLFFVGEAIVLENQSLFRAMIRSMVIAQRNFWPTLGLCILTNLIIYGFRPVWGVIGQHPLGVVAAIVANAYLATGVLLAIFGFYDNMVRRSVARRMAISSR